MKKTLILIAVALFIMFVAFQGEKIVRSDIQYVTVTSGSIDSIYSCSATACGKEHDYYFSGVITDVLAKAGQMVSKDQPILKYVSSTGKTVTLSSGIDGYVKQIDSAHVTVEDRDLFVYCYVPYQHYQKIRNKDEAAIEINGKAYKAQVLRKNVYDHRDDGYYISYSLIDKVTLLYGQKVIVRIPEGTVSGLMIDRKALYCDGQSFFVIAEEAGNDFSRWQQYRIEVSMLACNKTDAIIAGDLQQGQLICLLPAELRNQVER